MNTSDEFHNIYMNFIERFLISFPVMTKLGAMTVKTQKKTEKLQMAKIIIKLYISEKLVKNQSF